MLNTQKAQSENREAPPEKSSISVPSLSLPKGGGAIKGIDEKFSANPVTGTGALSVPVFTTASRSNFYPRLSLSYDSGAGNGPFGIGWSLSVPSITRKTDKGLPKYEDAIDSDIFILSEAEDLVPSLISTRENWTREILERSEQNVSYRIRRYRPRVEGLFARIEQWENKETGEKHWRSISKDNITSLYGTDANSRLADPEDSSRVFKWLLAESFDDKGNVILYEYKQENQDAIDPSLPQEKNRLGQTQRFVNRYLKRIKYGNHTPYQRDNWLFEVVFDYGEHDPDIPTVDEVHPWTNRPDPFSSFRACFEVRTHRLCQRVLMFHRFKELGDTPCLVRSTDLTYKKNAVATYLTSITSTGYIRRSGPAGGYDKKSLPPLEITYTEPVIDEELHFVDSGSLENLPMGLDGTRYQWVDLDSEGISGVLTEQASAWYYKRNLGNAQFAPVQLVATKPSMANLQSGQQQIMDLAGDGHKYLVQFSAPLKGFYEHQEDGQWGPFTPFLHAPNVPWNNPDLKFIDLDGDGHSDILLSEDEVFTWYRSLTKEGFEAAETVRKPFDEEKGPALVFSDATQSIYLADMVGDGLTDIVRVRNGEICYWPNKGYGNFGARVTMDANPLFDYPDYFDQKRIRLADIDGSGTTDIVYLGRDTITFWFNQAGNSWSEAHTLNNFPATDNLDSVTVIDFLGNGTACIVWSSPLPNDMRQPMRYIDLMSGQKPHLLQTITNNMGKETKIQYAPSTKFYLADQAEGRPWVTKLPFPVHVVERVETHDGVAETTFVTTYRYHHGYYDGIEREFRGFGCVEEWDAESFAQFKRSTSSSAAAHIVEEDLYVPPVHTKTWFHTGAYFDSQNISQHFAHEYYTEKLNAPLLPDTLLPPGLTVQEEQEACRALKGRVLRQEIYAEDGSSLQRFPYSVTEHIYKLTRLQPVQHNPHAVFYAHESEVIDVYCERQPEDPRIGHQMTLEVDVFGNVTKSAVIGYPRQSSDYPEQRATLITYTERDFFNGPNEPGFYRIGTPYDTRRYEISGITHTALPPLTISDVLSKIQSAAEIAYEVEPTLSVVQKRLIDRSQTLYTSDDLLNALPLGQVGTHALTYENYKTAFTPGLVAQVYGNRVDNGLLTGECGYIQRDGLWWMPTGRPTYDATRFYQPVEFHDPFGNRSAVTYDAYALLVIETTDALQNTIQARNNYRAMQPAQVTDPNVNRSAVFFDALGMVIATAVMGKEGQNEGDTLADPTTRLEYELFNWMQYRKPNYAHTFVREQHGPSNPRWQESYSYSDGSGREVMKKIQAEPGLAPQRNLKGELVRDSQGQLVLADTSPQVRWVGTGRTIYDNKENPVKKYEPFFSSTFQYEDEQELVEWGVTPILHYDPIGRLIRTDNPNGTFSRVEFDAWQQITWDENDTVLESKWYAERQGLAANDPEGRAAQLAAAHANTPSIAHLDVLGRTFLTIADNGSAGKYSTHVKLDIEGNQRVVTDARGRQAMLYDFDMLSSKLHTRSIDSGEHWTLQNVVGHPLRQWNDRGFQVRFVYDGLQRSTHLFVQAGNQVEILAERTVYGEILPNAIALNLRGRGYQHYDGAGVTTSEQHDFKGNLLRNSRRFARIYQQQVNWAVLANLPDLQSITNAATSLLESETFTNRTMYDALNRPTSITMPDNSEIEPIYNEANLLERLNVRLRGAANTTVFVKKLDYNAKGQRERIDYGNTVSTSYSYDSLTFRMINLKTSRASDNALSQDLHHTYDPIGNITEIRDEAQQTIFFNNAVVSPSTQYVYDAIYRLIEAKGREHNGQNATFSPEYDYSDAPRIQLPHPNDGQAMRSYTEQYQYDAVGNILSMLHQANGGNWTRHYEYVRGSNRLQSTSFPNDPASGILPPRYTHDADGNMTSMPHLPHMQWDFREQLQVVNLGGGGTAYYVYDASGQRVRKVVVRNNGSLIEERLYIGAYEIFRQRNGKGLALERETLNIMDDKKRIAVVETKTHDSAGPGTQGTSLIRYQLDNHLSSAVLELDAMGATISYEEYYPYGSTSYQAGRNVAEVSLKRYRYTGQERDDESGLYYHGARYCVPWIGRWTSCDPKGMVDGTNLYVYTRNNPIRLVDRTGTQSNDEEPIGGYRLGAGANGFPGIPQLKLDPPNFWFSSVSQGLGIMSPGTVDVEANLYGAGSAISGFRNPAFGGGGLQNAQFSVRKQIESAPGLDVGIAGGGSYMTQGSITGDVQNRGLFVLPTLHYAHKFGDLVGIGLYAQGGGAFQRTGEGSWSGTPTFSLTPVFALEPENEERFNLKEPSPSPYHLSLNSLAVNPLTFSYTQTGQLTQGPTLRNLTTVGVNVGIGINIGKQFVLLPEASLTYAQGSADPSVGQSASSLSYRAGLVGTFSYTDRTTSGPQTSSVSIGAWITQEFGFVSGPATRENPVGSFTTTTVIIGATFGFRRASLSGN